MRQHWQARSELESFVSGEMPASAAGLRMAHLSNCDECREELARFQDGLLDEASEDEAKAYTQHRPDSGVSLLEEVLHRAEPDGGTEHGRTRSGIRQMWRVWGAGLAAASIAMAFLFFSSVDSRRTELDALYLRAATDFSVWTGSPGRLVQPFTQDPTEPLRSGRSGEFDHDALQEVEEVLLGLELKREDEDRERIAAVAILRLSRGEVSSAWTMLEPLVASYRTPMSLSALACAALIDGDSVRLRFAADTLALPEAPETAILLYDRVLLHGRLGEIDVARDLLDTYRNHVPDDDPWTAQLESFLAN